MVPGISVLGDILEKALIANNYDQDNNADG